MDGFGQPLCLVLRFLRDDDGCHPTSISRLAGVVKFLDNMSPKSLCPRLGPRASAAATTQGLSRLRPHFGKFSLACPFRTFDNRGIIRRTREAGPFLREKGFELHEERASAVRPAGG